MLMTFAAFLRKSLHTIDSSTLPTRNATGKLAFVIQK
jgi:hypothetical protein